MKRTCWDSVGGMIKGLVRRCCGSPGGFKSSVRARDYQEPLEPG